MNEASTRRGIRFGAGVFLVAAGMQAAAHYHYYVSVDTFDARRIAIMQALQAYVVVPQFGTTLWTVLCHLSLAFAIMLALAGTAYWWIAKEVPAPRLRPLATASAWLCALGAMLMAAWHPVLQGVAILLFAAAGFAWASWSARPRPPLPIERTGPP